jgi:hypothetical protein
MFTFLLQELQEKPNFRHGGTLFSPMGFVQLGPERIRRLQMLKASKKPPRISRRSSKKKPNS